MSINNSNVVDYIGINLKGDVVLTIADELEWDEKNEHLLLLQDKLNKYLAFIESGEIYEQYPRALNRSIVIEIVAKYNPSKDGEKFVEMVKDRLTSAGYNLYFRVFSE